jgi:hypothetical protein
MQNRDMTGRLGFTVNHTPLGMNLLCDGSSSVSIPREQTQNASLAALEFPFVLGIIRGNLRSERNYRRGLNYSGLDIQEDAELYAGNLSSASPLWFSPPVYSLFDSGLNDALDKTLENASYAGSAENTRWAEALSLALQFPERYDPLSLVIPVSFSSRLDRNLEQRLDTRLDILTSSSSLGFSGINLFGAMGTFPLFNFYRNDEFRHSVSGIVSFPKSEDPAYRIQAEQNLNFFGHRGAELGFTNTYTTGTTGWTESLAVLWTVPAEKTLLSLIYDMGMQRMKQSETFPLIKTIAESEYERLRRESLELVIDRSGEYGLYSCIIGHESVVRILGRLTLSGFAKLNISMDEYTETVSVLLNLGTTLTVSF